jgi:hypothetical protein
MRYILGNSESLKEQLKSRALLSDGHGFIEIGLIYFMLERLDYTGMKQPYTAKDLCGLEMGGNSVEELEISLQKLCGNGYLERID